MELRESLELVAVDMENGGKKAVMTFLDRERREVHQVNFNRQSYDNGKYVDDPEKAAKVDEWCQKYFECTFEELPAQIGVFKDVYVYENFNSLWETEDVRKFTEDMEGQIFQTEVKSISVDDYFIKIRYDIDGVTYESKMTYAIYMKDTKEWFVDPTKKKNVFKKFEEKYGVPVSEAQTLIGHPLMVEVKKAFGSNLWGDIKKFPQKK